MQSDTYIKSTRRPTARVQSFLPAKLSWQFRRALSFYEVYSVASFVCIRCLVAGPCRWSSVRRHRARTCILCFLCSRTNESTFYTVNFFCGYLVSLSCFAPFLAYTRCRWSLSSCVKGLWARNGSKLKVDTGHASLRDMAADFDERHYYSC